MYFKSVAIKLTVFCLLMLGLSPAGEAQATVVRLQTTLGPIDIALYDEAAPQTVANFLGYVRRGDYDGTFIHRSIQNFVIQGGGYNSQLLHIPVQDPVPNEFSEERSNIRGTIAMAKTPRNPDSATSEWFVNLTDNSQNLDVQNGGFTVFGKIIEECMIRVDAIAALPRVSVVQFSDLPILQFPADGIIRTNHLVWIESAAVLPTETDQPTDRVFNYLEALYPEYIAPASQPSASAAGYYYRYYPATGAYVGMQNEQLFYAGPLTDYEILALGSLADWLDIAMDAGY